MVAEGPSREERPDDGADIDARFEEIVAGLRAEQAESQQRRREAIRRAQAQRQAQNRPLEGFDNPNPWPPTPRPRPEPPSGATPGGSTSADADGTNPPWSEPPTVPPQPDPPSVPSRPDSPVPPDPPTGRHGATVRGEEPAREPGLQPTPESWRSWEESDEEEHFIPPTPSLPAGDLHLWSIVVGLLGGPLLLVLSEVFNVLRDSWWTPLGILLSVGGVVLLFLRLPKTRDFTDSSGGAQV